MSQRIVFFHPDLGIGGAERLVIDAAVGLQSLGYKVTIFTSHCDPTHCFDEARDGTLDVRVRGAWLLPATILGRFKILFAILRQLQLLFTIAVTGELARLKPTAFFMDQLSAGIPVLRYLQPTVRILFYCHFPDLLLVQQRKGLAKSTWRLPFDALEGWGMRGADRVVVNSEFTRGVVQEVWRGLGGEGGVGVVYPCVNIRRKPKPGVDEGYDGRGNAPWKGKKIVLSINRFERKKNISLAIKAFAAIKREDREDALLVIAGGYDNRVQENYSYHTELVAVAESLGLVAATTKNVVTALSIPADIDVLFLLSIPNQLKSLLLNAARLLVYTPSNEHFGIVPLEAMLAEVPVLAANNGGPLETIEDGTTGWLCPPDKRAEWTEVMQKVLRTIPRSQLKRMGIAGRQRVEAEFSETKMAHRLDKEIRNMVAAPRVATTELQDVLLAIGVGSMLLFAFLGLVFRSRLIKSF